MGRDPLVLIFAYLLLSTFWGFVGWAVSKDKGKGNIGFILGFFIWVIGVLIAALVLEKKQEYPMHHYGYGYERGYGHEIYNQNFIPPKSRRKTLPPSLRKEESDDDYEDHEEEPEEIKPKKKKNKKLVPPKKKVPVHLRRRR